MYKAAVGPGKTLSYTTLRRGTIIHTKFTTIPSFDTNRQQRYGILRAKRVSRGHWKDVEQQRKFLDDFAQDLAIKEYTDWYDISRKEFTERGGYGLLYYYPSFGEALKAIYPEHPWDLSRFKQAPLHPPRYWMDKANIQAAIQNAEEKLGITTAEDWYWVSLTDLKDIGFPAKFSKAKLIELLKDRYPSMQWEEHRFFKGRLFGQKRLERTLSLLFPGKEIQSNARKAAGLVNPETGLPLELDIWIPSLNLAFEYQDVHHYKSAEYAFHTLEDYQKRDAVKMALAKEKGITIITIPYWWDQRTESLVATIKSVRPDLLRDIPTESEGIPTQLPEGMAVPSNKERKHTVEGIGEPTTACFMTRSNVNPTGWWMFEKYDGIRGFWNPVKKAFYSRFGNVLKMPQHIIDAMQPIELFLDGEIWFGRDNFHEATKIAQRADMNEIDWSKFKYMVYDIPNHTGTYEERYKTLVDALGKDTSNPYVEIADKVICMDIPHLESFYQDIIDKGGEGVILRDPNSSLKPGRSSGYLKHKKFRDAEAKIIQQLDGGRWECQLPNGVTFVATAGTSEFVNRWKPKAGDIVSFKHSGFLLASKKPKAAALYRLRPELSWEDVVKSFKEQKPRPANPLPLRKNLIQKSRPKGFWSDKHNWRIFFKEVAEDMGFDPLIASNWYSVKQKDIRERGGGVLLSNVGLKKALKMAFPDLHFSAHKGKSYWQDVNVCRQFFGKVAEGRQFNPLDVSQWYSLNLDELHQIEGGYSVQRYNGGFIQALKKAYPELQFKDNWKREENKVDWKDPQVCRTFFEEFAKEKGFDPLDGEKWYSINLSELFQKKGGYALANKNGGFVKALKKAFPGVTFKAAWSQEKRYYMKAENVRKFFDEFAKERGFDPLQPDRWRAIRVRDIVTKEGGYSLLNYWSFGEALRKAYPTLQFTKRIPS